MQQAVLVPVVRLALLVLLAVSARLAQQQFALELLARLVQQALLVRLLPVLRLAQRQRLVLLKLSVQLELALRLLEQPELQEPQVLLWQHQRLVQQVLAVR